MYSYTHGPQLVFFFLGEEQGRRESEGESKFLAEPIKLVIHYQY